MEINDNQETVYIKEKHIGLPILYTTFTLVYKIRESAKVQLNCSGSGEESTTQVMVSASL